METEELLAASGFSEVETLRILHACPPGFGEVQQQAFVAWVRQTLVKSGMLRLLAVGDVVVKTMEGGEPRVVAKEFA